MKLIVTFDVKQGEKYGLYLLWKQGKYIYRTAQIDFFAFLDLLKPEVIEITRIEVAPDDNNWFDNGYAALMFFLGSNINKIILFNNSYFISKIFSNNEYYNEDQKLLFEYYHLITNCIMDKIDMIQLAALFSSNKICLCGPFSNDLALSSFYAITNECLVYLLPTIRRYCYKPGEYLKKPINFNEYMDEEIKRKNEEERRIKEEYGDNAYKDESGHWIDRKSGMHIFMV